jgi:hypothetical protein
MKDDDVSNLYNEYNDIKDLGNKMNVTIPDFADFSVLTDEKKKELWPKYYKALALKFHPDKYQTEEDKELFTQMFKLLNDVNQKMHYYFLMKGGKKRRTRRTRRTRTRRRRKVKKTRRYY